MEEYLVLNHISKQFNQNYVLKDVNATLHKGEILGFLGPSGAGKTTTIKILTGQLAQTAGRATLLGMDVKEIDERIYEQIGILSDNSGIYERMSIYDNLKYFAKILQVPLQRIDELLSQTGLSEHKTKLASKLSKGQLQRLLLARAILHQPKVLFLDEPTSGLDPTTALMIHQLLIDLKNQGMAIFLTTHNMEEATKLCDHVALLNEGKIVEYGSPQEICLRYNQEKQYRIINEQLETIQLTQNDENIAKIYQMMQNDQIVSIHSCEPTLETVFLTVTGRELR